VRAFRDHPGRLTSGTDVEQSGRELKLLDVIVNSSSRAEMLEKLIEERVRSIFYGAPSDFFLKDKAKLKFGDYFSSNCPNAVAKFVEICARRNVLIHNDGKVDRKYLREARNSNVNLHETISVDLQYLRDALLTLRGLCATAGILVCERVYSNPVPSGRMLQRYNTFKP
jgi:hypothetical protein